MSSGDRVRIHYRRLPDREQIFDQRVVLKRDDVIVTLSQPLELPEPMLCEGRTMLENGSLALWFTFPGEWHDIGIFHRADRTVTGLYANILTPPEIDGAVWRTTDLFLDLWWPDPGEIVLLDEDELAEALKSGDIDPDMARNAQVEADRLLGWRGPVAWPPPVVREWTLARALEALSP